jgi:hypothetical protein
MSQHFADQRTVDVQLPGVVLRPLLSTPDNSSSNSDFRRLL